MAQASGPSPRAPTTNRANLCITQPAPVDPLAHSPRPRETTRMDRATLIRHMPLFESLAEDEVTALASRLEERDFDSGVSVFKAGDEGATLFLIQDGVVEISTG